MSMRSLLLSTVLAIVSATRLEGAVALSRGDVIVAHHRVVLPITFPVTSKNVSIYDSSGAAKGDGPSAFCVTERASHIYLSEQGVPGAPFLHGYDLTFGELWRATDPNADVVAVTADSSGRSFFMDFHGFLYVYSATGLQQSRESVALLSFGSPIDLAPDDCTLFYVGDLDASIQLRRFDVCSDKALRDGPRGYPLQFARGLKGGGFVGGIANTVTVFDVNDQFLRAIPVTAIGESVTALAFAEDPRFAWILVQSSGPVYSLKKVRLSDGATMATVPNVDGFDLAVIGEQRPMAAQLAPEAIPTLSPFVLACLIWTLLVVGVHTMTRS